MPAKVEAKVGLFAVLSHLSAVLPGLLAYRSTHPPTFIDGLFPTLRKPAPVPDFLLPRPVPFETSAAGRRK